MRTTLTIDDNLAAALKKRAYETGKPFKTIVNEVLRAGLAAGTILPGPRPFALRPSSLGEPQPGINLNKANALAGELEDEALLNKIQHRK